MTWQNCDFGAQKWLLMIVNSWVSACSRGRRPGFRITRVFNIIATSFVFLWLWVRSSIPNFPVLTEAFYSLPYYLNSNFSVVGYFKITHGLRPRHRYIIFYNHPAIQPLKSVKSAKRHWKNQKQWHDEDAKYFRFHESNWLNVVKLGIWYVGRLRT